MAALLTLTLALILSACGSTSPTSPSSSPAPSPSPTPSPTPAASSTTEWNVTQTFISVEGPDNCWIRYQRGWLTGAVFSSLPATITRVDGSFRIDSDWFQVDYAGTYSGSSFTATGVAPLEGGGRTCDGTAYSQLPGVSNLTGRFADDDQTFTATEVNSYRLTTGEAVTYRWAWTASRRN